MTDISKALRELLLARASGAIDGEEFERRQAALHAELLAEPAQTNKSRAPVLLTIGLIGLAAIVASIYVWKARPAESQVSSIPPALFAPPAPMTHPVDTQAMGGTPTQPNGGDLNTLAIRLAEKLAKNPANGEGWALLAQTYVELGQYKEADRAFSKAESQGKADARLLAEWTDAHVIANGRQWDQAARTLLSRALAADPANAKALSLAGSEAFSRGDYPGAIAEWNKLRAAAPPDSPEGKLAEANIAEANRLIKDGKRPAAQKAPQVAPQMAQ